MYIYTNIYRRIKAQPAPMSRKCDDVTTDRRLLEITHKKQHNNVQLNILRFYLCHETDLHCGDINIITWCVILLLVYCFRGFVCMYEVNPKNKDIKNNQFR